MDDEFIYAELRSISSKLSSTESIVTELKEDMGRMCDWKDNVLPTLQTFKDYMEKRADLPDKISNQEKELEKIKDELKVEKEANAESRKKTEFLMVWFWKISGAVLLLGIINILLVALGNFIDIQYVLK